MGEIGKLRRVELREVWSHEALDFTRWLTDNIDVLGDIINIPLSNAEREQSAGSFNVDILAEDAFGNTVVIENQLERSDHDHLGKLITYLAAFDAKTAIWISPEPRPEHVQAVTWLNESPSTSFYFLKLEAVQIGDSPPAPLLTLIVGPSVEGKQIGSTKKDLAERHIKRREFWTQLLERAKLKTQLHANISPSSQNWISASAGVTGISYNYSIRQHDVFVSFYINRADAEQNHTIFRKLLEKKDEIEAAFGGSLIWDEMEGRKVQQVWNLLEIGGWRDEDSWPEIHDKMIDAMIRLERAFGPHVGKLAI